MSAETDRAVDQVGRFGNKDTTAQHGPRVWPAQVIAMCQETLNCLATLRHCERVGALVATEAERQAIAADLETLGRCAFTLAEDFKKGGKR